MGTRRLSHSGYVQASKVGVLMPSEDTIVGDPSAPATTVASDFVITVTGSFQNTFQALLKLGAKPTTVNATGSLVKGVCPVDQPTAQAPTSFLLSIENTPEGKPCLLNFCVASGNRQQLRKLVNKVRAEIPPYQSPPPPPEPDG